MRIVRFASLFILCLVHITQSKPTTNCLNEGRGIGSSIWGWITYPFSWWSSGEPGDLPVTDQLVGPFGPYDNIEIAKHNVTVWCNDQTCTTMKCDKFGCKNVTCNIYETDMRGECREYNTGLKPEEPAPSKPVGVVDTGNVTAATKIPEGTPVPLPTTLSVTGVPPTEEQPLELEAVLSSTVPEGNTEKGSPNIKTNKSPNPQNKI